MKAKDLLDQLQTGITNYSLFHEEVFELFNGRKPRKSTFEQYDPSEPVPVYLDNISLTLKHMPTGYRLYTLQDNRRIGGESKWVAGVDQHGSNKTFQGYSSEPGQAVLLAVLMAYADIQEQIEAREDPLRDLRTAYNNLDDTRFEDNLRKIAAMLRREES